MQRGLHYLVSASTTLKTLDEEADRGDGVFGDHLRRLKYALEQDSEIVDALRKTLCQKVPLNNSAYERLQSSGILYAHRVQPIRLRCDLYRRYLIRNLCGEAQSSGDE